MGSELSLITTVLLILAVAIGGSVVALRLRVPSILGYIAGGIIAGALASNSIDKYLISMVSESGITLLLFALGIEFSFHKLKTVLALVAWPTIAQILLTFAVMFVLLMVLKLSFIPALYLAAAVALSSTAIVVKLLSQKGELDTVPGELATGWLVVQDLAVIPMLIVLSAVSQNPGASIGFVQSAQSILFALVKAGVTLLGILTIGRYGVPKLLSVVAAMRNRELLILTTIGLVFLIGIVMYAAGVSVALGAFLAGLLVAETSQNHAVFAQIRPLRDLFVVIFFVSIGMSLPLGSVVAVWPVVLALTVGVVAVKGGIIYALLRFMRYHRKPAFLVGLYLTQVSEFGFVLAGAGLSNGALNENHAAILIAVTFLTIAISAPAIAAKHTLYARFSTIISRFPKLFKEEQHIRGGDAGDDGYPIENHVVICGYGRMGKYIGRALLLANIPFLVVDYNQTILQQLKKDGIQAVYGDPADKEVLDFAQVDYARAVVIAIPDRHTQEAVISQVLSLNRRVHIICRTHHEKDQGHLKSLGVQTTVQPEFEAALFVVTRLLSEFGIEKDTIAGKVRRLKIEHGAS